MLLAPCRLLMVGSLLFLIVVVANADTQPPEEKKPGPLAQAWIDLADPSPAVVLRALLLFADQPDKAVPFFEKRLQGPTTRQLAQWISELDAPKFDDRQKAEEQLSRVADLAAPQLQKALDDRPSLEVFQRLTALLESQTDLPSYQARLRAVRAVAILEHIGTTKARQILAQVGGDGREPHHISPLAPAPSEEASDEPVLVRRIGWLRTETRCYAAARALERLNGKSAEDDAELITDFLNSDTEPAARAFLVLGRPKALREPRKQACTALLRVAEVLQAAPPLADKGQPRPFECPWSDLLPIVRPETNPESAFRQAVRSAAAILKESHEKVVLQTFIFAVPRNEKEDRDLEIEQWQRQVGFSQYRVQQARLELEEFAKENKEEPPFWQAAAEALIFHLMVRELYLDGYNFALARVRRNDLPDCDPKTANGWRLVTAQRPPIADQQKGHVLNCWRRLAQRYPGSLWEAMATQEMASPLGLIWMSDFEQSKPPQRVKGRAREKPSFDYNDCPP